MSGHNSTVWPIRKRRPQLETTLNLRRLAPACILFALINTAGKSQTAGDFFSDEEVHELRLEIHPSDWQKLRANYLDNTYYPCNLIWRGRVAEEIAIRSRGFGSRDSTKPGLRVDFNRYAANQRFLGLKSVVLDNVTQDPSLLRERVSMALFRRMGLPAPRESHARLYVNDLYVGLYLIVESVDQGFLKRNLGEDEGYLYDYEWTSEYRFEFLGDDPSEYVPIPFKPATHELNPAPVPLATMIRVMNDAPAGGFENAMAAFLDLKLFLRHVALETYLAEIDGIFGFWGMNNFYLYRFKDNNRFQFIAWDKDVDFDSIEHPIFYNFDTNVLGRKSLEVPELRKAYLDSLEEIAVSAGGPGGWLEQEIARAYQQVRASALADTAKPHPNETFEEHADYLQRFARERSESVMRQIAAARVR